MCTLKALNARIQININCKLQQSEQTRHGETMESTDIGRLLASRETMKILRFKKKFPLFCVNFLTFQASFDSKTVEQTLAKYPSIQNEIHSNAYNIQITRD